MFRSTLRAGKAAPIPEDMPEIGFSASDTMKEWEPSLTIKHAPESKAVGFWGWARSPSRVAKADPHANTMYTNMEFADRFRTGWLMKKHEAYQTALDALKHDPDGLQESIKKVGQFALKVEGGTPQFETLFKQLSPAQQRYYGFIRQSLDELADWLHVPKESRIINYVGHVFDKADIIAAWQDKLEKLEGMPLKYLTAPKTEEGKQILARLQDIERLPFGRRGLDSLPKELINQFLLERKTGLISEDFSIDKMYRMYLMKAARTGFDNPAMLLAKQEIPLIKDPALRQFMTDYAHQFFMRSRASTAEDFSRLWMSTMFALKLGLNLRSPLVNLSQTLFTNARIGVDATTTGASLLWKSHAARELFEESFHSATIPQFYRYDVVGTGGRLLQRNIPGTTGVSVDSALEELGRIGGIFFNAAEYVNRGTAYLGGIYKALLKEGLTSAEALTMIEQKLQPLAGKPIYEKILGFADELVNDTQFRYGRTDLPSVFRKSPVTRALLQFQSFGMKATEFMWDLWKTDPEKLLGFLAIQYGATMAGKHLLGIDLRDVLGIGVDPIAGLQALQKMKKGDIDAPSITKAIQEAFPLVNGRTGLLPGAPGSRFGGPAMEAWKKTQETLEKVGVAFEKGKPFSEIGQLVLDGMSGTFSMSQWKRSQKAWQDFKAEREQGKVDNGKLISVLLGFPNYRWLGQQEYLHLHRQGKTQMAEDFKIKWEEAAQEALTVPQSLVDDAIQNHAEKEALRLSKPPSPMGLPDQLQYLLGR